MISIIIPITGPSRIQHVTTCIALLRKQTYTNYEIILVEQIDCDIGNARSKQVLYKNSNADKHIVITNKINHMFNQPWMSNVGAMVANGDKFLFFDADVGVQKTYLQAVHDFPDPFFFSWQQCYHYTKHISAKIHKKRALLRDPNRTMYKAGIGGHAGYAVCATRDFFFGTLGGYIEDMFGWGGNDQEIMYRSSYFMKHKARALPQPIFHMWHGRSYAKASVMNRRLVRTARKYPDKVSNRLKKANIGKKSNPTRIPLSDILVPA